MSCHRFDHAVRGLRLLVIATVVLGTVPWQAMGMELAKTGTRRTVVSIDGTRWLINGQVTYPGSPAEGLLMNVRMVNATFEDLNRQDFDPEANTERFLAHLPDYVAHGIR
ncbi:MAG: hypothetical protein WBH86_14140, partial [Thermogutta sp.]